MSLSDQPSEAPLADEASKRRALMTVALTLFLDLAGFGIILPILPYYAESFDASATMVTLLSTTFSAAQFVMAPVLGRLSDRHGRRPVMLISIAGSVAAGLVLGLAGALWVIFMARLVAGASKANVSTAHAYVADLVAPDQRARYMGLMGAAMGMGFVFGPAIGGLLTSDSFPALPFFVSAGLSALNLLMAWLWLPETRTPGRRAADSQRAPERATLWTRDGLRLVLASIRGTPMAWLVPIAFCFFIAFAGMESTLALFSEHQFGWGGRETGLFMTFIGLNMVLFQGLLVGRAVAAFGEARTLALGLILLAVGLTAVGSIALTAEFLGLPLTGGLAGASSYSLLVYAIGGALMSGGNGLTNATLSALVSQVSSPEEQGWNMGIKESAAALARIAGPALAGPLFQYVDPGAPLLLGAIVALIAVRVALSLRARMRAVPTTSDLDTR